MHASILGAWLVEHEAADGVERLHVCAVLRLLADVARPFARDTFDPGHVTASAFVLSADGEDVLLIHHGKLRRWLQPGGHIDADDVDVVAAARREVLEETGLEELRLEPGWPMLLDVDVHEIPAHPGRGEPAHRHYDVRLLFRAIGGEVRAGSDASDARWFPLDAVEEVQTDASVLRAVARLRARKERVVARAAPATGRNRAPLLEVLRQVVAPGERVLEIASGTGEHAAWLAPRLGVTWQPTDLSDEARGSMEAWRSGVDGVLPPMRLDAEASPWLGIQPGEWDVVFNANMAHISPWRVTEGLIAGASAALRPGGALVVYGPWRVAGAHTADSNARFDRDLRDRDPAWGVRDLEALVSLAGAFGLRWWRTESMPANNLAIVFERVLLLDPRIEEVLFDWFGDEDPPSEERQRSWWSHEADRDEALRERFGKLQAQAAAGELQAWSRTPRGRLALILLLDQHTRHVHRGTAEMFAQDAKALRLALEAVSRGEHLLLQGYERAFLLMPLMHAEDRDVQTLSVAAFSELAESSVEPLRSALRGHVAFAVRHRVVIDRFGRYPHRNVILGRQSTPEEHAFLEEPGSSF